MDGGAEIADVRLFVGPGELEVPSRPDGLRFVIFEPSPGRAHALRERFAGDVGTKIIEAGLSDEGGRSELVGYNHPAFDSFCRPQCLHNVAKGLRKESEVEAALLPTAYAIGRHLSDNQLFELILAANGLEERILSSLAASDLMKRLVKLEIRVGDEILFDGGMDEASASAVIEQSGLDLVGVESFHGGVLCRVKGAVGLRSALVRLGRAETQARSMNDLARQAAEESKTIAAELEPLAEKYEAERDRAAALEKAVAELEPLAEKYEAERDRAAALEKSVAELEPLAEKYEAERDRAAALEKSVAELEPLAEKYEAERDRAAALEKSVAELEPLAEKYEAERDRAAALEKSVAELEPLAEKYEAERDRAAALEKAVAELEPLADIAEKYEVEREKTATFQEVIAELELSNSEMSRAQEETIKEHERALASLRRRIDDALDQKNKSDLECERLKNDLNTRIARISELEDEFARAKRAQELELGAQIAEVLGEAEAAFDVERQALVARASQARAEAKAEISGLVDRLDEAKLRRADEARKNAELEKSNRGLASQVRDGEVAIARLQEQARESAEKSRSLTDQVDALRSELSAVRSQNDKRVPPEELDRLQKAVAAREAELEQLRKDQRLSSRNYIVAINDLEDLRRKYDSLDLERRDQRTLLERMVTRLSEASEYLGGLPTSDVLGDSSDIASSGNAVLPKAKKKRRKRSTGKVS